MDCELTLRAFYFYCCHLFSSTFLQIISYATVLVHVYSVIQKMADVFTFHTMLTEYVAKSIKIFLLITKNIISAKNNAEIILFLMP